MPLVAAPGQQPAARQRRHRRRLGDLLAAQLGDHLGQRPHPEHRHARAPSPPPRPAARARRPGGCRASAAAITIGSTPGTDRSRPSRVSSPMNDDPLERAARHLAGGGQHGDGDRQVEVGAALGQVGRRQQDRDPPGGRPVEAAVDDRRPAAVAGLVERGVGPADQRRCRPCPGETSACTSMRWPSAPCSETVCAVANGISRPLARARRPRPPRRGRSTPTRSMRTSCGRARRAPPATAPASRRSRVEPWRRSTASSGVP